MQVSQPAVRDMDNYTPLQVSVTCTTKDALGYANPFCPFTNGIVAPATGFQFVPTLTGTACTEAVPRVQNRTAFIPWLSDLTSQAGAQAEIIAGVPADEIGTTSDAFQINRYSVSCVALCNRAFLHAMPCHAMPCHVRPRGGGWGVLHSTTAAAPPLVRNAELGLRHVSAAC